MPGQGRPLFWNALRNACWRVFQSARPQPVWHLLGALALLPLGTLFAAENRAELRLETNRPDRFFVPGEEFRFNARFSFPDDLAAQTVELRLELFAAAGGKALETKNEEAEVSVDGAAEASLSLPLPYQEGIYTLSISATPPPAFQRFIPNLKGRPKPVVQREFQVVVLDPTLANQSDNSVPQWAEIDVIEPTEPKWWQKKLPAWTQLDHIPGMNLRGPSGSTSLQIVELSGSRFVELPPPSDDGKRHWQAYVLSTGRLNEPHRVEVEYPAGKEFQLGLSIVQPNSDSSPIVQHHGTTVFVGKHELHQDRAGQVSLVFWPKTASPVLLVTNDHPTETGHFGRVRVAASPGLTKPQRPLDLSNSKRLVAHYLSEPIFPQFFATGQLSPTSRASRDLQDWYLGSERFADYIAEIGCNAAIVAMDLRALLAAQPAAELNPLRTAGDFPPPDGLEILLRIFDRSGQSFYPALRVGQTDAVALRTFLTRYGHHRCLAGVAIQLSATRPWNPAELTQHCRELTEQVLASDSNRRVLFTLDQLLNEPRLRSQLQPALPKKRSLKESIQAIGVDSDALQNLPGAIVLLPQLVSPEAPLVDRAVDMHINDSVRTLLSGGSTQHGLMVFCRPSRTELSTVKGVSFLGTDGSGLSLFNSAVAAAALSREPYVDFLASSDANIVVTGGPVPSMVVNSQQIDLLKELGELPANVPAEQVPSSADEQGPLPIMVRLYRDAGRTSMCVMNVSPWQVRSQLTLQVPQRTSWHQSRQRLADAANTERNRLIVSGNHAWPIQLEPYELGVFHFDTENVKVTGVQFEFPEDVRGSLQSRVDELRQRDLTSAHKVTYQLLANPSFEMSADGGSTQSITGWQILNPSGTGILRYDDNEPVAGESCLLLQTTGNAAGIQSRNFRTPPTGQLALTAYIRAENVNPETQLRFVFETDGPLIYRQSTILGRGAQNPLPSTGDWRSYTFSVQDLPLDSNGEMRVRFELHGSGSIWIDELQLHNVPLVLDHLPDSTQQRLMLFKAMEATKDELRNNDLVKCRQILDGYWLRFVDEYLPLKSPAAEREPQVAEQPEVNQDVEEAPVKRPTMSQRFRDWGWFPFR